MFQAIKNRFKKRAQTHAAMIIEVAENAENDDGNNNEPLKHVAQQKQDDRNGNQHFPADFVRIKLGIVLVDIK